MSSLQAAPEHGDDDEIEATEMNGHQEPSRARSECSNEPVTTWGKVCYNLTQRIPPPVKKFWRNQISVTVDHDNCRDHWGRQDLSQKIPSLSIICI